MNVGNTISDDTVSGDGGTVCGDWIVPDFKLLPVSATMGATTDQGLPADSNGIGYS